MENKIVFTVSNVKWLKNDEYTVKLKDLLIKHKREALKEIKSLIDTIHNLVEYGDYEAIKERYRV